jgi:hypothetical protein
MRRLAQHLGYCLFMIAPACGTTADSVAADISSSDTAGPQGDGADTAPDTTAIGDTLFLDASLTDVSPSDAVQVAPDATPAVDVEISPDATPLAVGCKDLGTSAATAGCLTPTKPPEYYVAQAEAYFDTLDTSADPTSVPNYSDLVARWEWPPWLLLTGLGRDVMNDTAAILRQYDPSTVPTRDCRFFTVQPFARCRVSFQYAGGPCPIYEEFIFNDAGEMTFIEAWSDVGDLSPVSAEDPWAEAPGFVRLGTRIPGLGYGDGRIDIDGVAMTAAAKEDADVAAFVERAHDFWPKWLDEFNAADADFFAKGCGW